MNILRPHGGEGTGSDKEGRKLKQERKMKSIHTRAEMC